MDAREARQLARQLTAELIVGQLQTGWPCDTGGPLQELSGSDDEMRIVEALRALAVQLVSSGVSIGR